MDAIAKEAATRRALHAPTEALDAWRLVNGTGDGAPAGLTVDRYDVWRVISARDTVPDELVRVWCDYFAAEVDVRGVILKRLRRPARDSRSALWSGEPPPRALPIREGDVTLLCDLDEGLGTGVFLDQREVRFAARRYARDVDVLNLFAYTGAFSVHAARAGARRVTSIDAARHALARGRDNMRASGLDPDQHRWFPDDVRTHLERAGRRGDSYGLVILDPPMFGRARAKVHTLRDQLGDLVALAGRVVAPGGVLIVSTHALELDAAGLRAVVTHAVGPHALLAEHGLPAWDHPTGVGADGADRGDYLKSLTVRLDG